MFLFDIEQTALDVLDYRLSYVELIGTLFGLISVYLASKTHLLTWAIGIVNEVFLFVLFYQVQLYADMLLQIFFLVVTLYGWYNWQRQPEKKAITWNSGRENVFYVFAMLLTTLCLGYCLADIHLIFPLYFVQAAAYPYLDAGIMVSSVVATFLLARKKIETWLWWIAVDVSCVGLFYVKGIYFLSAEYLIFLGLAATGFRNWKKQA